MSSELKTISEMLNRPRKCGNKPNTVFAKELGLAFATARECSTREFKDAFVMLIIDPSSKAGCVVPHVHETYWDNNSMCDDIAESIKYAHQKNSVFIHLATSSVKKQTLCAVMMDAVVVDWLCYRYKVGADNSVKALFRAIKRFEPERVIDCLPNFTIDLFNVIVRTNKRSDKFCHNCEKTDCKVMHCSGCNAVSYCSSGCQSAAWKSGHKHECKELKAHRDVEMWSVFAKKKGIVWPPPPSQQTLDFVKSLDLDAVIKSMK